MGHPQLWKYADPAEGFNSSQGRKGRCYPKTINSYTAFYAPSAA